VAIWAASEEEALRLALEQLGRTRAEVVSTVLERTEDEVLVAVALRPAVAAAISQPPTASPHQTASPLPKHQPSPPVLDDFSDDFARLAAETLEDLLDLLGVGGEVKQRDPASLPPGLLPECGVVLAVYGAEREAVGLLIGRYGQTLDALELILNQILAQQQSSYSDVVVDVDDSRLHRAALLTSSVREMAATVQRSGAPAHLVPLSASEQRIVRTVVGQSNGLRLRYAGEGRERHLLIAAAGSTAGNYKPAELAALARELAREVVRSGQPVVMEPLPANQRKVVHSTLLRHPLVQSKSSGGGVNRHVVIRLRAASATSDEEGE